MRGTGILRVCTLALLLAATPVAAQEGDAPIVGTEAPSPPSSPVENEARGTADGTGLPADPADVSGQPISEADDWSETFTSTRTYFADGGAALLVIAALSVITLAIILWKTWRLVLAGAWSRRASARAVSRWESGDRGAALAMVERRRGMRSRFVAAAMRALEARPMPAAREEATRQARDSLERVGTGLRALELIATIAPLLGLLGTVLGMIEAFRQLQEAGAGADPAVLAGGIWEALLTTAAGMAVAIPASAALTWFEAVIARARHDMESLAARLFIHEASQAG